MVAALNWLGRLPLRVLLGEPSIMHARIVVTRSQSVCATAAKRERVCRLMPGFCLHLLTRWRRAQDRRAHHPARLADTLEHLAHNRIDDFFIPWVIWLRTFATS